MTEPQAQAYLELLLRKNGFEVRKGPEPVDIEAIRGRNKLLIEVKGYQKNPGAYRIALYTGLGQILSLRDERTFRNYSFCLVLTSGFRRFLKGFHFSAKGLKFLTIRKNNIEVVRRNGEEEPWRLLKSPKNVSTRDKVRGTRKGRLLSVLGDNGIGIPSQIYRRVRGRIVARGSIKRNGMIEVRFKGKKSVFSSLSSAADHVIKSQGGSGKRNGWQFWEVKHEGEYYSLDTLRV